jgi:hypothetical protein
VRGVVNERLAQLRRLSRFPRRERNRAVQADAFPPRLPCPRECPPGSRREQPAGTTGGNNRREQPEGQPGTTRDSAELPRCREPKEMCNSALSLVSLLWFPSLVSLGFPGFPSGFFLVSPLASLLVSLNDSTGFAGWAPHNCGGHITHLMWRHIRCSNSARTDLCGGRSAMAVPTATRPACPRPASLRKALTKTRLLSWMGLRCPAESA